MELAEVKSIADRIRANVEKVIVGKRDVIDILLSAVIAGGHVLIEDVPGTGKTMLSKSIARSIGAEFKRVQFTPDLLPSDLTGINYYNQKEGKFLFRRGPLFTNILLADEINRATPRTQSSLLECMEEKQISIDGVTHKLEDPFFVIATQNPVETAGTFPLPEAQLDRFLVRISVGYPTFDENMQIIDRFLKSSPIEELSPVCSEEEIAGAKGIYSNVYIGRDIRKYIINIVEGTLKHGSIKLGVSPRGILALVKMCQSFAAIKGRDFVTPDDVRLLAGHVLCHRMILKDNVRVKGTTAADVLNEIMSGVSAPTENWKGSTPVGEM